MKPIYEPRTKAKEYCDLAINIYTGCNHGCVYCYAPRVLHKTREQFAAVEPRKGIVDALKKQLATGEIKDREIQLCFTCDSYPAEIDTAVTREVIEVIKNSGNHVRILTKGGLRAVRDFDLLDSGDWYGVTYSGIKTGELFNATETEPNAAPHNERLYTLAIAHKQGIKTWVSCEPVIVASDIINLIGLADYIDVFKIGKLNYAPSDIDWAEFGRRAERECQTNNRNYYIKDDLRAEMEHNPPPSCRII